MLLNDREKFKGMKAMFDIHDRKLTKLIKDKKCLN